MFMIIQYLILKSKKIETGFLRISVLIYTAYMSVGREAILVTYKAFSSDVAQGCMNGVPIETQTHSWRFASLDW